jgi:hypothetical protein
VECSAASRVTRPPAWPRRARLLRSALGRRTSKSGAAIRLLREVIQPWLALSTVGARRQVVVTELVISVGDLALLDEIRTGSPQATGVAARPYVACQWRCRCQL